MPIVSFQYQQRSVHEVEAEAEVPAEIIAQGDKAIVDWLEDNPDAWQDGDYQVIDWGETVAGSVERL